MTMTVKKDDLCVDDFLQVGLSQLDKLPVVIRSTSGGKRQTLPLFGGQLGSLRCRTASCPSFRPLGGWVKAAG